MSILELVLYMGIASMVLLWAANFIKVPVHIDQYYQQSRLERNLNSALDAVESDLREADPASISAVLVDLSSSSLNSITFQTRSSFNINFPTSTASAPFIQYDTETISGVPSLVRTVSGVPQVLFSAASPSMSLALTFSSSTVTTSVINVSIVHTAPATRFVPTPTITSFTRSAVARS